jgi:SAM-dependent methyltransferase
VTYVGINEEGEPKEMAKLTNCRVCGTADLVEVLNFGDLALTGVFPATREEVISSGNVRLLVCSDCGLVQLGDTFPPEEMYGDNYGYRSGLNASMVAHLARIARRLETRANLSPGQTVLDIGANDGTLLRSYSVPGINKIGIDPTIAKFSEFYEADKDTNPVVTVADFFNFSNFDSVSVDRASIVTSIAMFYDLDDPVAFAKDIKHCMTPDGIWYFEQSYMPWMLRSGAYDTICHEHLEYYSLTTIKRILDDAGLYLLDAATNAVNGGSVSVLASPSPGTGISVYAQWLLDQEAHAKVHEPATWINFRERVLERQKDLRSLLQQLKDSGATVMALGASTKGNVLVMTTPVTSELVSKVGDVNPYKYGRFLPGSHIPIVSEEEVLADNPDYLLILPWHFRETFMNRLQPYLAGGGRLIFPLPDLEVVGY